MMSKRCELQKEYYKKYGNYKGNGKYTDNYVNWLESRILALTIFDVSQQRELLNSFAEEYNYPHNSKIDCITKNDIDSYLKDKTIL